MVVNRPPQQTPNLHPRARKSLAQHFLIDQRILGRIISAAEIAPDDLILEVGPGRGVLTRELAQRAGRLVAVEIDETLAANLTSEFASYPNVAIVTADAREIDVDALVPAGAPYKLVANLPYYAASPIVRRFLGESHRPQLMVVMVQREVAQNMAAAPGDMTFLSVAIQLYGRPKIVCSVPPGAFRPMPKVTSAVVRIDVYPQPALALDSEERFFTLLKAGFSSPRKQIHNCLRQGLDISRERAEAMLAQAGIDSMRRPETLSVQEWGRLYQAFHE